MSDALDIQNVFHRLDTATKIIGNAKTGLSTEGMLAVSEILEAVHQLACKVRGEMNAKTSLRDRFAAQALQAIIAASAHPDYADEDDVDAKPGTLLRPSTSFWEMRYLGPDGIASGQSETFASLAAWEAYAYADAMLIEREKKKDPTP